MSPTRSVSCVSFDGAWPQAESESPAIWEHFLVDGPRPEIVAPPADAPRHTIEVNAKKVTPS